MNEALQRWREDFARDPDTAFDRLVRGLITLGSASQLSFGEIIDDVFEPGDVALDQASGNWLESHILGPVPEGTSLHRWAFVLEEYFRGIAAMELPKTGEVLRNKHKRIRLWLHGFYEGLDRDPEGTYLLALARAQNDQRFSPLWRRLVLGEELEGRSYLGVGILGFRKMPGEMGHESSDVPQGLLQALVALADKPGTSQARWKQTMHGLFATYRRSEAYWVEHLVPLLRHYQEQSNARDWLNALLPQIREWRTARRNQIPSRRALEPPGFQVSRDWPRRVRQNPTLCDTAEFAAFLDQHRAYAEATGHGEYISKTFNNLSTSVIRADRRRMPLAVSLIKEALKWDPRDPRNWTSYAIVLSVARFVGDAIDILWRARHHFAFDPFIRNELGRILRENGELSDSEGVFREAASHFPGDVVCRTGLAETLRVMGRLDEAREIYEQACDDFPNNVFCRNGLAETLRAMKRFDDARQVYEQACLDFPNYDISRSALADLLIDLGDVDTAERIFRETLEVNESSSYSRAGLARTLAIRSARNHDVELRDKAKRILQELAEEGNQGARTGLRVFDDQWERARSDPAVTFRRETEDRQPQKRRTQDDRPIAAMSVAERLGRAMITLWQIERAGDATLKSTLCTRADALLEMSEEVIDDDLLSAFVETRGLVLLAGGHVRRALAHFERQIRYYGRGGWIGVRLGEQRARILLGEPTTVDDIVEPPGAGSARFALYVMQVVKSLSSAPQESEVREILKRLYLRASDVAGRVQPDAEGGQSIKSGAEMLGAYLQTRWFRAIGMQSVDDLDRADALHAVLEHVNNTRTETFDVISNSTFTLAA